MENISDRQQEILDFIEQYVRTRGHSPSFREIAGKFDVAVGTVQDHIEALVKKKLLKKGSNLSRSFQVVLKSNTIPIFAFVKAGSPGLADEEPVDYLTIEGTLGVKAGDRGMMVRGDSMIDAGIIHGSIVFYRKVDYVNENAIVIARLGEGPVVKRFTRSGGRIVLKSENPHYKPIVVDPKDGDSNFEILGKVISVVKNYAKNKPRREN